MKDGRHCDECGTYLNNDDFDKRGSWSYTCPKCGYRYIHGSPIKIVNKILR